MTDEQIIEGLRCCNNGLCEMCPYHEDEFIADCREQNGNDALDLINRQKEEIVDEREKKEMVAAVIARQDKERAVIVADRDNLMKENNRLENHFRDLTEMIRAEAIREFAERAYKKITEVYNKHIFGCNDLDAEEKEAIMNFSSDVVTALESIEKEMMEGQP